MNFAKQFLIYGIMGAISRLAAFLLVPIYTRAMPIVEYGQLEILLAIHMLLVMLVGLQGESAVGRDFFRARKEGWEHELAWGAICILAIGTAATSLIAFVVPLIWDLPEFVTHFLPYLFLLSIPTHLIGVQLVLIRFNGRAILFSVLTVSDLVLTAIASIYLIGYVELGITGAIAGLAVGKTAVMLAAWPASFGRPPVMRGALKHVRGMLAYSLPTVPAVLLNWLQTIGTRVIWALFFTVGMVALAGIGMRVASIFGLAVYSFRLAWEPQAFSLLEDPQGAKVSFARMLQWSVLGLFSMAGAALLAAPLTVAIFAPPQYRGATELVGAFVFMQLWLGIGTVTSIGIHGARVTSRLTYVYALAVIANLGLLSVLSTALGLAASAAALLGSTMIGTMMSAWYSNRHFDTRFSWRLLSATAVLTIACSAVAYFRPSFAGTLWPAPMLALSLMLALVLLIFLGISSPHRRAMVADLAGFASIARGRFRK